MSKFKIFVFMALITLSSGIVLVGGALAGERIRARIVYYDVKWEQVTVGDEEGHIIGLSESKGITTVFEGEEFRKGFDGSARNFAGLVDINLKTGRLISNGYDEVTNRQGDKYFVHCESRQLGKGDWTIYKGTGKWDGIKGKGTYTYSSPAPKQSIVDIEGEVEIPR